MAIQNNPNLPFNAPIHSTPKQQQNSEKPIVQAEELSSVLPSEPCERYVASQKVALALDLAKWKEEQAKLIDKANEFQRSGIVEKGVDTTLDAVKTALEVVSIGSKISSDAVEMNPHTAETFAEMGSGLTNLSYGLMAGNQAATGGSYANAKFRLEIVKSNHRMISKQIELIGNANPNDPALADLTAKKLGLEGQIKKLEECMRDARNKLLMTTAQNSAAVTIVALGKVDSTVAQTVSASGGVALGALGVAAAAGGLVSGAVEHVQIDNEIASIARVNEKHSNTKISEAMRAVKTAAIVHASDHRKHSINIGVVKNGLALTSSAMGVAGSAVALIGSAVVGAALGVALPIITGLGLLVGGMLAALQNRNTISRGLKAFVEPAVTAGIGRFSPKRNLTVRQWSRQYELKTAVKDLEKLLLKSTFSSKDNDRLTDTILKQNRKIDDLTNEIETIRYKRATQTLKDETSGIFSDTQKAVRKAIHFAADDVVTEKEKIQTRLNRLNDANPEIRDKAFEEFSKNSVKKGHEKLTKIDRELSRLDKPSKKLLHRFELMYEKQLATKTDRLRLLGSDSGSERRALESEILQLTGFLADILSGVKAEKKRLSEMRETIVSSLDKFDSTPENISDLKESYETRIKILDETHQELKTRFRENLTTKNENNSAKSLVEKIDALSDTELLDFVHLCKTSFPGIKFDEFEDKQDRKQYVKTVIQKAIVSNALF